MLIVLKEGISKDVALNSPASDVIDWTESQVPIPDSQLA